MNKMDNLFNRIADEIGPDTMVDLYIFIQRNLKNIENKVRNFRIHYWETISRMLLTDDFIRDFRDEVDWKWISSTQQRNENFIEEFKEKINWEAVSRYQDLSEDFIKQHQDKLDWKWISRYQVLSEDFIQEFQNKVHWNWISKYQRFSEDFIREFQDKVDWKAISKYQNTPMISFESLKINWIRIWF